MAVSKIIGGDAFIQRHGFRIDCHYLPVMPKARRVQPATGIAQPRAAGGRCLRHDWPVEQPRQSKQLRLKGIGRIGYGTQFAHRQYPFGRAHLASRLHPNETDGDFDRFVEWRSETAIFPELPLRAQSMVLNGQNQAA